MAALPFPDDLTEQQAAVADEIRAARNGRLPDLFRMLLHSPAVARGWLGLGTAIRYETALDDGIRELVICYVSLVKHCPSEVTVHGPLAEAAGIPADVVASLPEWRASSLREDQRVALELAEVATAEAPPDDGLLATAMRTLSTQGVLELLALVAYYTAIAVFLKATGMTPLPPPSAISPSEAGQ